jgi:hypothetical protein
VECKSNLPQVIDTLPLPRGLARRLYCRQQERDQHTDDGDHREKLNQHKTVA